MLIAGIKTTATNCRMQGEQQLETAIQLHGAGRLAEAEVAYLQILRARPDEVNALHLLGMVYHQTGRNDQALPLLRRAVQLAPAAAQFHSNLAGVLGKLGRPAEAVPHLRAAIRLQPELAVAHNNLGVALEALGALPEAAATLRNAIRIRRDYAEAFNNLGNVLQKLGPISEAVSAYRRAISLRPDYPEAYGNLAAALGELGQMDEAFACYSKVIELRPEWPAAESALLFALHYRHGNDPRMMYDRHAAWARRHAEPLYGEAGGYENVADPARRLRVGYVSQHFRAHPVSRFFEPILRSHDREQVEVFCFADVSDPDAVTDRLKVRADVWREVAGLTDGQLADLVRADRIDVLVDLAGHMAAHRLTVFARKPAPVQVSYIGYPDTTGLATMDYRVTDSLHDPPGLTESYHTEELLRLDPCCWCYAPDDEGPPVAPLPALSAGFVTFASLNRLVKGSPETISLWGEILSKVLQSRLVLLVGPQGEKDPTVYRLMERHGVPPERLRLVGRLPRRQYLDFYHTADIALDTFPYNGHTTTLDALWMGVPTVSLAGGTHVSRAGLSVLSAVGLAERLVASSPEDYVNKAAALANDLPRLAELRAGLRERVVRSPLRNEVHLTASLESLYRRAWTRWCSSRNAGNELPRA